MYTVMFHCLDRLTSKTANDNNTTCLISKAPYFIVIGIRC